MSQFSVFFCAKEQLKRIKLVLELATWPVKKHWSKKNKNWFEKKVGKWSFRKMYKTVYRFFSPKFFILTIQFPFSWHDNELFCQILKSVKPSFLVKIKTISSSLDWHLILLVKISLFALLRGHPSLQGFSDFLTR